MIDTILNVIAPFECLVCNQEGSLLCMACSATFAKVPSRCFRCMKQTADCSVCLSCRSSLYMNSVWVCGEYSGTLKDLIHKYKFELKRGANSDLVRLIDQLMPPMNDTVIVMSVPTATSRVRERGFDHAKLLAQNFASMRGLTYYATLHRSDQHRQLGLGKIARQKAIKNSFYVKSGNYLNGAHVLLIDDVVTTGASLSEAARVLKQAGAMRVDCAVVAQTIIG